MDMNHQLIKVKEIEEILIQATGLKGVKVKDVANETGISINTLYKWRTTDTRLSNDKIDLLITFFEDKYPYILERVIEKHLEERKERDFY